VTNLWDPLEEHYYWDGSADADNRDAGVYRSDDITHAVHSPNNNSRASLVMEWNSRVDTNANSAEIQTKGVNLDFSKYWYFKFDVYRPRSTSNVNMMVYLWDGRKNATTIYAKADTPDRWTTVKIPIFEPNNLFKNQ